MRTIITHFDGDPFLLSYWLSLYEKHWRGETDRILMAVTYHPEQLPANVIEWEKKLVGKYPEIICEWRDNWEPPETVNARLFKKVEEGHVGFVESDGLIFQKGLVDGCFKLLEEAEFDIVAPKYMLLPDGGGYMRCFFFSSKKYLDRIEFDLTPRTIDGIDLDCFGYVSYQLNKLDPEVFWTEANNCHPVNKPSEEYGWLHIRQMSSSALGMGGGEYSQWSEDRPQRAVKGHEAWVYTKALAFRLLFWEATDKTEIKEFTDSYYKFLERVSYTLCISSRDVEEMKEYYKGIICR